MDIKYIPFEEIDKVKWNSCIHYAVNSEVSGYYWWLKAVVKEWDAVVEGDYESVMPVFKKKDLWGRNSIYQPPLVDKIGIQSVHLLSRKRIVKMLELLPEYYSVQMKFNEMNIIPPDFEGNAITKKAYRILLNKSHETLKEAYGLTAQSLLMEPMSDDYYFQMMMKPEDIVHFAKSQNQLPYDEHQTLRVFYNLLHRGTLVSTVIQNRNRDVIAMMVFTYHLKKVKVLLSCQTEEGKAMNAVYRLYDHVFNLHQQKPLMFEFFQTDAEVAKELGAEEYNYWEIQQSDLLGKWSERLEKISLFS